MRSVSSGFTDFARVTDFARFADFAALVAVAFLLIAACSTPESASDAAAQPADVASTDLIDDGGVDGDQADTDAPADTSGDGTTTVATDGASDAGAESDADGSALSDGGESAETTDGAADAISADDADDADDTDDTDDTDDSDVLSADSSDTVLDVLDATVDSGGGASDTDAADPSDGGGATASTLVVTIQSDLALAGSLKVMLVGAGIFGTDFGEGGGPDGGGSGGPPFEGEKEEQLVYEGILPDLPVTFTAQIPAGEWLIAAMVLGPGGFMNGPLASDVTCIDGQPKALTFGGTAPAVQNVTLELHATGDLSPFSSCGDSGSDTDLTHLFIPLTAVATPPTKDGGAHFMSGLVWEDRLFIAGSQDGFVSFHFPVPPPAKPAALSGWKVYGQPFCNRLVRSGGRIFCGSRGPYINVLTVDPITFLDKSVATRSFPSLVGLGTEGMAVREGTVWIAAHSYGLLAISDVPPFDSKTVVVPSVIDDAWDVAPLGKDRLLVANGPKGLAVLDVAAANAAAPKLIDVHPLGGVAAFLAVDGEQVAVGALGGGLHVLRIGADGVIVPQGSLEVGGMIYGVDFVGDIVVAAGGHNLIGADRPPLAQTKVAPLVLRGLDRSFGFALDVFAYGDDLLVAEFQLVRHVKLQLDAPMGPMLVVPASAFAPLTGVGQDIKTRITLRSQGSAPVNVSKLTFLEGATPEGKTTLAVPPFVLAPGTTKTIDIAVPKTVKGLIVHAVEVHSDDVIEDIHFIDVHEVPYLQPGEALPNLAYADAAGKLHKVEEIFAGKVGVLVVAAESCPVAFMAIAAAWHDLADPIAKGNVALVGLNPWDNPNTTAETQVLNSSLTMLYSPLTTLDGHDWSEVIDVVLGQAVFWGPPMPIVYVVDAKGIIVHAGWGYETGRVLTAIAEASAP